MRCNLAATYSNIAPTPNTIFHLRDRYLHQEREIETEKIRTWKTTKNNLPQSRPSNQKSSLRGSVAEPCTNTMREATNR